MALELSIGSCFVTRAVCLTKTPISDRVKLLVFFCDGPVASDMVPVSIEDFLVDDEGLANFFTLYDEGSSTHTVCEVMLTDMTHAECERNPDLDGNIVACRDAPSDANTISNAQLQLKIAQIS